MATQGADGLKNGWEGERQQRPLYNPLEFISSKSQQSTYTYSISSVTCREQKVMAWCFQKREEAESPPIHLCQRSKKNQPKNVTEREAISGRMPVFARFMNSQRRASRETITTPSRFQTLAKGRSFQIGIKMPAKQGDVPDWDKTPSKMRTKPNWD